MHKTKHFKLYIIEDSYINYLRQFDNLVPYNKNHTRPYIGIVYTYNNTNYFAPLSSPKPKHLKMKTSQIDIYKIDNGKLGIININNMIPTPIECLTEILPIISEQKYKTLLENQISFINIPENSIKLLNKVNRFQEEYRKNLLPQNILERTCNFPLLEEKCKDWIKLSNEEQQSAENNTSEEDEDEPEM